MTGSRQTKSKSSRSNTSGEGGHVLLQRKCACGGSLGSSGQCGECESKQPTLQRYSGGRAVADRLLVSQSLAEQASPRLSRVGFRVQRFPAGQSRTGQDEAENPPATPGSRQSQAARGSATAGLIAEDEATSVTPSQMRKSAFLDELQSSVCAVADAELARVGRNTQGCPYIENWIGYYRGRTAQQVERSLHRYAPEASGATTARQYMPLVAERIRRAVSVWAKTGQVTGVPDELAGQLPSGELGGAVGGILSGMGSAVSGVAGAIGGAIGGIFAKGRDGGAREQADPVEIQGQLGQGQPLDAGVRSRLEPAFGHDFSRVRVHSDSQAANLSAGLNARAFTIGGDVAFAAGEYMPGTLIGDALIAHELAHVMQQNGSDGTGAQQRRGGAEYGRLEEDADQSAVGAVALAWGRAKDMLSEIGSNAMPSLRSGLRLQRCKSERQKEIERLGGVQYAFLEEKRKKKEAEERKNAEEEAKKRGEVNPKIEPKVTVEDVLKEEVKKSGFNLNPTAEWDDLPDEDKNVKWPKRAKDAWDSVVASVKGTELEKVLAGKTYRFEPKEALLKGYYAYQDGDALVFGMVWVKNVETNPKNAWPNVAHELGGHREYGTTYASEIMQAAIENMPKAEREKWQKDAEMKRQFYLTYEYPETEIFAALRELRYADPVGGPKPAYGGLDPYVNIPQRLNLMKSTLAPEVAKAVLLELKRRVDAAPEILERDKKFFVQKVSEIFGYKL